MSGMDTQTFDRLVNENRVRYASWDGNRLAHEVRMVALQPRRLKPYEKQALLYEAAERIEYGKGPRRIE